MVDIDAKDLKIDAEFASWLPPLTKERRIALEEEILEDGAINDPIIAWHDGKHWLIADGHNRYDIWQKNKAKLDPPEIKVLKKPSRDHVLSWIFRHNDNRRNWMSKGERDEALAKAVKVEERLLAAESQPETTDAKPGQNVRVSKNVGGRGKTSVAKVAKEAGVSERTVRRAVEKDEQLATIAANSSQKVVDDIKSGAFKLNDRQVAAVAALPPNRIGTAVADLKAGRPVDFTATNGKPPKNGQATSFSNKTVDDLLNKLVKAINEKNKADGKSPHFDVCKDHLNDFLTEWNKWKKAKN